MPILSPQVDPAGPVGLQRLPQTHDELWWAVKFTWDIEIPRVKVCPNHAAPFDAFADAYFAESPVSIWKASRGYGGKSFLVAVLALTEAVFLGAESSVLGGSAAQSLNVHSHTHNMWAAPNAPRHLLAEAPTKMDTFLTNGAHIRALMASQRSVRGPHPQRLRLDEIDEMELDILEAAQGQPMPSRGIQTQTVMSSTHQYPDATMSAMLERGRDMGWPLWEWCIARGSLVRTARGGVPIQEVTADDVVMSHEGWRRVQHVTRMGVKEVVRVRHEAGYLICTPDHKVLTTKGWVRAESLTGHSVVLGTSDLPTGAALTVPTVWPDVHVVQSQGMADRARSWAGLTLPCPAFVFAGRDGLKVSGVDAVAHGAEVVDLQPIGDLALDDGVCDTVRLAQPPIDTSALPVPVLIDRSLPEPAPVDDASGLDAVENFPSSCIHTHHSRVVSVETWGQVEVWDIGVHGTHSFVADDVVVHNCYRETMGTRSDPGWLKPNTVLRKKQEVAERFWLVEYDLQAPSFEGRAIDSEKVEAMFYPPAMRDDPGTEVIIEQPMDGRLYFTGVDWAKEKDWTVIRTFDGTDEEWNEVAFVRVQRRPWPEMVKLASDRVIRYPGVMVHDATGLGNVIDDYLEIPRRHARVVGEVLAGRHREVIFNEYISAIEDDLIRSPRIEFAYYEHLYTRGDDLFKAGGHPPDSFVAGALAWFGRNKKRKRVVAARTLEKGRSQWRVPNL